MNDNKTRIQAVLGDKYEIRDLIQAGGMGQIFLGVHKALDKKVAIKIIHQELVKNEHFKSRFYREAKLSAGLDHSGIIDIYDFGSSDDFDYIIMPFIEGETLEVRIKKQGPMDPEDGVRIMIEIADALHYAHSHNVIHRDIKPSNIMIDHQGKIILADFGISKMMGDSDLTAPNTVLGSPKYMSPEQIKGQSVDARSDLYSLGLVFYEMLTGIHPFTGRDTSAIYYAQAHEIPPRPETSRPEIPKELGSIIMKLLAKSADKRYADGGELLRDLRDYQQGKPLTAAGSEDATVMAAAPPGDDATIVDAAIVDANIADATIVDPTRVDVRLADAFKPETAGPGRGTGVAGSETLTPEGTLISTPATPSVAFFKQHVKSVALVGAVLLLVFSTLIMLFSGPSDEEKAAQTTAQPEAAASADAGATPDAQAPDPPMDQPGITDPTGPTHTASAAVRTPADIPSPSPTSFLQALADVGGGKAMVDFSVWADRQTYRIGETIRFQFETGRPCYALILGYTTNGELVQIFPNHYNSSQFIQPGRTYSIPDEKMDFDLQVYGPAGQETVIALVSDQPFQIFGTSFSETHPFLSIGEKDAKASQLIKNIAAISGRDIAQQRLTFMITD